MSDTKSTDFKRVAECLYRRHAGKYYALVKVAGKQIRRSLHIADTGLVFEGLKEKWVTASAQT
jgi:hypothetical protein